MVLTAPIRGRLVALVHLFEGIPEQRQVGSAGQVEMSRALRDRPPNRIGTLGPPRIRKIGGEKV